jgi:hypothetical protein
MVSHALRVACHRTIANLRDRRAHGVQRSRLHANRLRVSRRRRGAGSARRMLPDCTMSTASSALSWPHHRADVARGVLLGCGILSSLVYIAANVLASVQWPSYSSTSQTISELSAIDAPSRSTWVPLGIAYDVLVIAFGIGVWSATSKRALRVTAGMLIAIGALGLCWPPMHLRGAGTTLTDTLHVAFAGVASILVLLSIGFGTGALGIGFRLYSIATLVLIVGSGALASLDAPKIATGEPTPWIGVYERIDIGGFLLWTVALALALLRSIGVREIDQGALRTQPRR